MVLDRGGQMVHARCDFGEFCDWMESPDGFSAAFKSRPGLKIFPRSSVVNREPNELRMNISNGKRHVVLSAWPADEGSVRIAYDMRGVRFGYVLGWCMVPLAGLGLLVLLRTWAKRKGTVAYARKAISGTIEGRFGQLVNV